MSVAPVVRSYLVRIAGSDDDGTPVTAPTVGAAKYNRWLDLVDVIPDLPFTAMRAKVLDRLVESDGFRRCMERRGVPWVRVGMRIRLSDGRMGTIVGHNDSANLDVILDGDTFASNCHPLSHITYLLDDGTERRP